MERGVKNVRKGKEEEGVGGGVGGGEGVGGEEESFARVLTNTSNKLFSEYKKHPLPPIPTHTHTLTHTHTHTFTHTHTQTCM